jgi:hypothetical protein
MRYILAAIVQAVGIVWVGFYAAGNDDYYQGGVTRWEHATRGGSTHDVAAPLLAATAIAVGFFLYGLSGRRRQWATPLAFVAGAVYVVCLGFAWVLLTSGH